MNRYNYILGIKSEFKILERFMGIDWRFRDDPTMVSFLLKGKWDKIDLEVYNLKEKDTFQELEYVMGMIDFYKPKYIVLDKTTNSRNDLIRKKFIGLPCEECSLMSHSSRGEHYHNLTVNKSHVLSEMFNFFEGKKMMGKVENIVKEDSHAIESIIYSYLSMKQYERTEYNQPVTFDF
jgi:hypothetical protein